MKTIATIDGIAIEQGCDNPYADLGFPDADEMLVKAGLAHEIAQIIKHRRLTQLQAANSSACRNRNSPRCCAADSAASARRR